MHSSNNDLWIALGEMFLIGSASYAGTITANQKIERERAAVAAQQQQQVNTEVQKLNWQVNYFRNHYNASEAVVRILTKELEQQRGRARELLEKEEKLIEENKRLRKLAKKNKKQRKRKS